MNSFWEAIEKSPPHAPPGCETGGIRAFIIWFGGLSLMFLILGILPGIIDQPKDQIEIDRCVPSQIEKGAPKEWALGYCSQ